jgi:hypothetical protein
MTNPSILGTCVGETDVRDSTAIFREFILRQSV